jgi:hypothetical protein
MKTAVQYAATMLVRPGCVLKFASLGDAERCLMWCSKCSKRPLLMKVKMQQLCPLRERTPPQAHLLVQILPFSCFLLQRVQSHCLHKRDHFCCTLGGGGKWDSSNIGAERGAALRESRERPKVTS